MRHLALALLALALVLPGHAIAQNDGTRSFNQLNSGTGGNFNNTNLNSGRSISSFGKAVLAVYADETGSGTSNMDILANVSFDGGQTFTPASRVDVGDNQNEHRSDAPWAAAVPDPTNPGQPIFFCAWNENRAYGPNLNFPDDVFGAWSTDGVNWTLSSNASGGLGGLNVGFGNSNSDIDQLRIYGDKTTGTIHVVWEEDGDAVLPGCSTGTSESVFYTRSIDGGRTFEAARPINVQPMGATCNGLNDVDNPFVHSDDQVVAISFISNELGGDDVFGAISVDNGLTFTVQAVEAGGVADAGDVDGGPVAVDGLTVAFFYQDSEINGSDLPTSVITNDAGFTFNPEFNVSPATANVNGAGVAYLSVDVTNGTVFYGFCSDWDQSLIGGTPSNGGNDDFRTGYISWTPDFGANVVADIALDNSMVMNELYMEADDLKVFCSLQPNPFGRNDYGFTASFDGGQSFAPVTVTNDSFFGDIDQGSEYSAPMFAADFENDILHGVLGYNGTGQNETYYSGRRYPWFEVEDNGVSANIAVDGAVLTTTNAASFIVGLSQTGPGTPFTVGSAEVDLVVDMLTIQGLTDPSLLSLTSGLITAPAGSLVGEGSGATIPSFSPTVLGIWGQPLLIDGSGTVVATGDYKLF